MEPLAGAFRTGLLEEDDLEIAGISGTTAGALNGAALKAGLLAGGQVVAQERLHRPWTQVGEIGDFRMMPWVQPWLPALRFWQEATKALLPVSAPGISPQHPDFISVGNVAEPRSFVSATNVRTGRITVFEGDAIAPETLVASVCLPTVFQAVESGSEAYWDGGYSGNPALFPLHEPGLPDDILVVSINRMWRDEVPASPLEIRNRINEIGFNAGLLGELRAINFGCRLIAGGRMESGKIQNVRVHIIADEGLMNTLSASTRLAPLP